MKNKRSGPPLLSRDALLGLLPQHCRLTALEMAALVDWTPQRRIPKEFSGRYEKRWLYRALQQSRDAVLLADKWRHVSVDTLFRQKLDGLDDFSLATYATAVLERDHEYCNEMPSNNSWSKICDVYHRIVDNPAGTVLLNYSWLYGDMLQLCMVDDAQRMRELHDIALAFELRRGSACGVCRCLAARAANLMQTGCSEAGTMVLARILETHGKNFEVCETVANTLFDANQFVLGQLLLDAMASLSMEDAERQRFEELCWLYLRESACETSLTHAGRRVAQSLLGPTSHEICLSDLVVELVPHIASVPVKKISF